MIEFCAQVSHYKERTISRDNLNGSSRPNGQRVMSILSVSADKLALLAFLT